MPQRNKRSLKPFTRNLGRNLKCWEERWEKIPHEKTCLDLSGAGKSPDVFKMKNMNSIAALRFIFTYC